MHRKTPYQQVRQIGFVITRLSYDVEIDRRSDVERRLFDKVKTACRIAQDKLKDYEQAQLDEDTTQQAKILPSAVLALEKLRDSMLKASEYELIGAVDVAQISAELDELIVRLR